MASDKQNLQDAFLNHVRKTKVPVTIFLINGQNAIWVAGFAIMIARRSWRSLVQTCWHASSPITTLTLRARS